MFKVFNIAMVEIDGVCLTLEHPCTEAGDYISDEYLKVIDLSTAPHVSHENAQRIANAVRRLNRNLATTSVYLVGTESANHYDEVVTQLNALNTALGVGELKPLITDVSRFEYYSPSFRYAV